MKPFARPTRRLTIGNAIIVLAATMVLPLASTSSRGVGLAVVAAEPDDAIRPFQFHASDEALSDLRRRIAATRWSDREVVTDAVQGVQSATMRALAQCWQTDYD